MPNNQYHYLPSESERIARDMRMRRYVRLLYGGIVVGLCWVLYYYW